MSSGKASENKSSISVTVPKKISLISGAPLRETAWIDGFRGISALYPCCMHLLTAFMSPRSGTQSLLLNFFVLGGYVSSKKALSLMDSTDLRSRGELLQTLSASAFRRGFRLYLPAFVATFITALCAYAGVYDPLHPYLAKDVVEAYFPGMHPPSPVRRFATMGQQLLYWYRDMFKMSNIWPTQQHTPVHNAFLWTLREEFRCSIHLYVVLLSCARLKPWARFAAFILLGQYHNFCGHWEIMLYFFGAATAQGEIMTRRVLAQWRDVQEGNIDRGTPVYERESSQTSPTTNSTASSSQISMLAMISRGVWMYAIYNAVILGFYPPPVQDQTAYAKNYRVVRLLDNVTPTTYPEKDKLYDGFGCVIVLICMLCADPSSLPRRIFTNNYAQYLGRAFFGIILVQGTLLHAGGYIVPHIIWGWMDSTMDENPKGWLSGVLASSERQTLFGLAIGLIVNVPLTIAVGDLFTRTVVRQCMVAIYLLEKTLCMPVRRELKETEDTSGARAKKNL